MVIVLKQQSLNFIMGMVIVDMVIVDMVMNMVVVSKDFINMVITVP